MKREFLVWGKGKQAPKYIHNTYESALEEARRLARKELVQFDVIERVASVLPKMSIVVVEKERSIEKECN